MKASSIIWRRTFPNSEPGTDGVAIFEGCSARPCARGPFQPLSHGGEPLEDVEDAPSSPAPAPGCRNLPLVERLREAVGGCDALPSQLLDDAPKRLRARLCFRPQGTEADDQFPAALSDASDPLPNLTKRTGKIERAARRDLPGIDVDRNGIPANEPIPEPLVRHIGVHAEVRRRGYRLSDLYPSASKASCIADPQAGRRGR